MAHIYDYDKVNKIITIPAPETEITIQHLLNDIRDFEDELSSMDIPKIASAAGKEPLGGGVTVGITLTLENGWRIKFEDRAGPDYIPCRISGGNLVTDTGDIPYLGSSFVTVGLAASSSATTADLEAIQYASYGGGVSLNIISGTSGTDYPIGTKEYPVNNLADAVVIANTRGFKTIYIEESMTLENETVNDFILIGRSHVNTFLTIDSSLVCSDITIENANVTGILDGGTHIHGCMVGTINYVNGHIHNSGLYGTITLNGNKDAAIVNCFTVDQDNPPIIDMLGSGQDLSMPNYSGLVTVTNFNDVNGEIGIGLNAGVVVLESDIIAGTVIISGVGILQDNSTGTTNVNTDGLMSKDTVSESVWNEQIGTHLESGTTGLSVGVSQYGGVVTIDTTSGNNGTTFPMGTSRFPVDNLADAVVIAQANGINKLYFNSDYTFDSSVNISDFKLVGDDIDKITFTCEAGSILANCKIYNAKITGQSTGFVGFFDSHIDNFGSVGLVPTSQTITLRNCLFSGTIDIPSNYSGVIRALDCWSNVAGTDTPILNHGGSTADINIRNYSGGIKLENVTEPVAISVDITQGQLKLENTCTDGVIAVRGVGDLTDNSNGSTIVSTAFMNKNTISGAVWNEPIADHLIANTTGHQMYHQSYRDIVHIDSLNGVAGITYPIGTAEKPVNNLEDAITIATTNNFTTIYIVGTLTINSATDLAGFTIGANSSVGNSLTITSMVNTGTVYFKDLTIAGTLSGETRFTTCVLGTLTGFDGGAKNCLLTGDIEIVGNGANYFTECDTYVTDSSFKSINVGDNLLNIIKCRGSWEIDNYTGTNTLALDFVAGNCQITSNCTSGIIVVSGLTSLADNSAAGCTVIDTTVTERGITDKIWNEPTADHVTAGSTGKALTDAGSVGNPWSTPVDGNTTAGTFGELVGKKLLTFAKWFGLKK